MVDSFAASLTYKENSKQSIFKEYNWEVLTHVFLCETHTAITIMSAFFTSEVSLNPFYNPSLCVSQVFYSGSNWSAFYHNKLLFIFKNETKMNWSLTILFHMFFLFTKIILSRIHFLVCISHPFYFYNWVGFYNTDRWVCFYIEYLMSVCVPSRLEILKMKIL